MGLELQVLLWMGDLQRSGMELGSSLKGGDRYERQYVVWTRKVREYYLYRELLDQDE